MQTGNLNIMLAELCPRLEALYEERLVRLVLFGSQARGDAEPNSDIDILVILKEPGQSKEEREKTLDITAELSLRYDEVISTIFVSEDQFSKEQSPLLIMYVGKGYFYDV